MRKVGAPGRRGAPVAGGGGSGVLRGSGGRARAMTGPAGGSCGGSCVAQSAKLAPKYGLPVVETPELLGAMEREPVAVIFEPLEGR
ncbi:hypothetical protein GCM10010321_77470 [Streptomyces chartreusis]|nr:hypothetical protein GCM10010321_77470 [Streptomyces chartreusis]